MNQSESNALMKKMDESGLGKGKAASASGIPMVAACDEEGPGEANDLRWLFQPATRRSTCR